MRAIIFCDIPEHFRGIVHASYTQAFQAYQVKSRKDSKMDTSGMAQTTYEAFIYKLVIEVLLCRPISCMAYCYFTSEKIYYNIIGLYGEFIHQNLKFQA